MLTVALGLGLVLAGCSSAGYRKSDAVALSMKSAAAEVQVESQELERVMGNLKQLMDEPSGDLKIAFRQFSTALDRLKASARRTNNTGHRMSQRGAEYFQAWNKQLETIDYEHVREVSATRRTEASASRARCVPCIRMWRARCVNRSQW